MITYLDASALVKLYIAERGSEEVRRIVEEAQSVGTATITRVEVTAALGKAVRVGVLAHDQAAVADASFRRDWPDFLRVPATEHLLERAAGLAWGHHLRGYDAVQLAAALSWQEALESPVTMATFDRDLWTASASVGLGSFPEDLGAFLAGK
jgi:predicted nucleic acid-binding protein